MPKYDYFCEKCQKNFEVYLTYEEKDKGKIPECPVCKSKQVSQIFSGIGIVSKSKSKQNLPPCYGSSENCCNCIKEND